MKPLIIAGVILIGLILAIIAIIVVLKSSKKNQKISTNVKQNESKKEIDFQELIKIVSNKNTSSNDVLNALILFNKYFRIDDKHAHDYLIFLSKCLTHKNVNKSIFQYYHNEVKKNNEKYKTELDAIEMKALG